jgi:iron complex outermembrane recepter protein
MRQLTSQTLLAVALVLATTGVRAADDAGLEEIIVRGGFRPVRAGDLPASVTVLDQDVVRLAGQQTFADLTAMIPNLNWAGDSSRPRYFQLRGVGELEQYQGAPNASVGFLIDEMDFSGLGGAATLLDVDRIEVLRGPQATRFGANALAGLIYVRSAEPLAEPGARLSAGVGDYATRSVEAVVSGPVAALDSGFRLAASHYYSDGYYRNAYLGRDDTNRFDESTLKGRWRYSPAADLTVDLALLHVQLDNGYDAFAIDNSRTTRSDHPGSDVQHSTGGSLNARFEPAGRTSLTTIATWVKSRVTFGYDGDWGNPVLWAPYTTRFDYTEVTERTRTTRTLELRLAAPAGARWQWLVGAYGADLTESYNDRSLGAYADPTYGLSTTDTTVTSDYRARTGAAFADLSTRLTRQLTLTAGLRTERRSASYDGATLDAVNDERTPAHFAPVDRLWGGQVSLSYAVDDERTLYAALSRGYKAGGFNLSQGLEPGQVLFRPEWDLNAELGLKGLFAARRVQASLTAFYVVRHDAQIKTSTQSDPKDPNTFVLYTGNAASGRNFGLEAEVSGRLARSLELGGSLGLLQTRFRDFTQSGSMITGVSRELANAPHWQAALNATWHGPAGSYLRIDATGMGSYYFDLPPNPTRSAAYGLVNAKLGIERSRYSADIHVRNLMDRRYPVRGFYFGDEPPDFPNKLYLQLGEPRTLGVRVSVKMGAMAR